MKIKIKVLRMKRMKKVRVKEEETRKIIGLVLQSKLKKLRNIKGAKMKKR